MLKNPVRRQRGLRGDHEQPVFAIAMNLTPLRGKQAKGS
jgi:hypothetical protein